MNNDVEKVPFYIIADVGLTVGEAKDKVKASTWVRGDLSSGLTTIIVNNLIST